MSVRIRYAPEFLGWIVMRFRGSDSHGEYLTKDGWTERKPAMAMEFDDTMIWDEEDLRELVSQLAAHDIKPKEASFTEGKLQATKIHLEDMRSLVFKRKPTEEEKV